MNQEKVTMEKELREELERHLEQKENEISEIRIQINNMEEMWREERKRRKRFEKEVHDQSKMLTAISQVVQNIAVIFDCNHDQTIPNPMQDPERTNGTEDPLKDDIIERRQPFMQGTKASSKNS
ncbi:hypothetical protein CHS0354_027271 [Potamilus streckersoni]|uniref:Uncharacterized protein n=1 Tax=Potamilus streckersoni TaxID=2493646 RepID=A0AAE0W920_9BIVA|nr:hypothetical protein CHS0354_027271 [Potamilus streckersoni]